MSNREERQREFERLFNETHGTAPYKQILPITFRGKVYTPEVVNKKEFYKVYYRNEYNFVVYIGKEEYGKVK